jgi:hypothetical protein
MVDILKCFVIIIFLLNIISCSSTPQKLDVNKNYKMDLFVQNKEISFIGMGVLKSKDLYTIEFEADEKIDLLSFRTCSRETIVEDPRRGLSRKKYLINYRPNEIEREGNCPAVISTFNDKLFYSVSFIDFEDSMTTLPAEIICGAKTEQANGVSTCQERSSSITRIKFDTEVLTSPDFGCEIESGNKGKIFEFRVKPGFCVYAFISKEDPSKRHRLTVYGYTDFQIRN